VCPTGWYGSKCDKRCGHCARTSFNCQVTTGACQECDSGWTGDNCEEPDVSTISTSTEHPPTTRSTGNIPVLSKT